MYHSKKYEKHNIALNNFIKIFNKTAINKGNKIKMYYQEKENYIDDGGIIYIPNDFKILYDFEKRFSYYYKCNAFKYKTLGQFDRKIRKPEIKLSIQCSKDEKCFMVAWHEDYFNERNLKIGSKTEICSKEYDGKRFTKDFIEISYQRMDIFYDILYYAFQKNVFNKENFKAINY